LIRLIVAALLVPIAARSQSASSQHCGCPSNTLIPGMVRYSRDSARSKILEVQSGPRGECGSVTLSETTISVTGGTFSIHVKRSGRIRIEPNPCGLPRFIPPGYTFEPQDHRSITLMIDMSGASHDATKLLTEPDLWALLTEQAHAARPPSDPEVDATRVMAPGRYTVATRDIAAHYIEIDGAGGLYLGPEAHIKAGQICQIELADGQMGPYLAARCYARNPSPILTPITGLRAWWRITGGPNKRFEEDELFRSERALIVAVDSGELTEINVYLDGGNRNEYP